MTITYCWNINKAKFLLYDPDLDESEPDLLDVYFNYLWSFIDLNTLSTKLELM